MKEKQKCSKNIKATAKMETIRQGLRKASSLENMQLQFTARQIDIPPKID